MSANYYCVIMGGGIGSRFWPLSREMRPKQFLDIFGTGRSLLRMTFDRFAKFIPKENILVVTNEVYKSQVLDQLPEMKPDQVLLEPMRRNTAPCIAYACHHIKAKNQDACIVVSPSDHLILDENRFEQDVCSALQYAETHRELVTLGILPSRAETGYGYIQMGDKVNEAPVFHQIKTFTEKPNIEMAEIFYKSGEFLWNSGMFIWHLDTIMRAFDEHLPELSELLGQGVGLYATAQEYEFIHNTYERCPNISIDYGIMEKVEKAIVLPVNFGWADLGTWGSLYELKEKDEHKNVVLHTHAHCYESKGNIISMEDPDSLVVIEGISDCIIAQSGKALLICHRSQEQRIKEFMSDVSIAHNKKYD